MATWLEEWKPEDKNFWETKGKKIAWKTLTITTISLTLSFATWFLMSTIATKLPGIGFKFTENQLFWLTALPGLAAGTLRIMHTFLIPIFGTRHIVSFFTLIKLLPVIGLGLAIMNPGTPFWVFAILSFSTGFGGGDFSSFMPSTNLFFPARLKGTALGIQAGIGNFGVSIAQFMTPALLGVALVGAPQIFTKPDGGTSEVYLQNSPLWFVPLILIMAVVSWFGLKSVKLKSTFKEQLEIFGDKHTWFCTITYFMTFGVFSGLSGIFPMMIKVTYGGFEDAPDPLKYAFYGPFLGSLSRVLFGFVADKVGGAVLTTLTGIGFIGCIIAVLAFGLLTPTSVDQFPLFLGIMLTMFFFSGIGNAGTFRQYPIIFSHNPVHASGVIGWTAAIAAYGPFIFSMIIATMGMKNVSSLFYGLLIFSVIATVVNWYFYQRKGAERPS